MLRVGDVLRLKTMQTFWGKRNSDTYKTERNRVAVCLLLGYEYADETSNCHKPLSLTDAMHRLGWVPDKGCERAAEALDNGD